MPKIKQMRQQKSIKQDEFLEQMGSSLNVPQYSLIESGKVLPTPDMLRAICDVLGCTPKDLYDSMKEIDLQSVQREYDDKPKVSRFDSLPPANPRIMVRLPEEQINQLKLYLGILGYTCFGQYVRKVIIPDIKIAAMEKYKKHA